jgi:hypothetical protein
LDAFLILEGFYSPIVIIIATVFLFIIILYIYALYKQNSEIKLTYDLTTNKLYVVQIKNPIVRVFCCKNGEEIEEIPYEELVSVSVGYFFFVYIKGNDF